MRLKLVPLLLVLAVWATQPAAAATRDDFTVRTVQNLASLCSVGPDDPLREAAMHFCQGYIAGAYQYQEAAAAGPRGRRLICLTEPRPTRDQAVAAFVSWTRAHPQYMNEPAIEGLMKFATETWPCRS